MADPLLQVLDKEANFRFREHLLGLILASPIGRGREPPKLCKETHSSGATREMTGSSGPGGMPRGAPMPLPQREPPKSQGPICEKTVSIN